MIVLLFFLQAWWNWSVSRKRCERFKLNTVWLVHSRINHCQFGSRNITPRSWTIERYVNFFQCASLRVPWTNGASLRLPWANSASITGLSSYTDRWPEASRLHGPVNLWSYKSGCLVFFNLIQILTPWTHVTRGDCATITILVGKRFTCKRCVA